MVKAESARPEACDGRGGGEDEVVFPPLVDNEEAVPALHRRRDPVIDARVLGAARRSYAEFGWAAFHFDRVAKAAQSAGTFSTGGMLIVRRCCSKRWPTRYLLTTDGDEPFSDGSEMPTAHAANGSRPPKHVVAPSRYSPSKRASCSRACSPAHAPPSPYYRIVIYTSACVAREHLCARLEDVSPGIQGARWCPRPRRARLVLVHTGRWVWTANAPLRQIKGRDLAHTGTAHRSSLRVRRNYRSATTSIPPNGRGGTWRCWDGCSARGHMR